jgi:hypothetical protein
MKFLIILFIVLSIATSSFCQSEAEVRDTIQNLINKILERPPNYGEGISYLTDYYYSGHSLQEVMILIGSSDEYRNKFVSDKTPYEVLSKIYNAFLDRPVDSSDTAFWSPVLLSDGYVKVITGVVQSDEFNKRFPQYLKKGSPPLANKPDNQYQITKICAIAAVPYGWIKINDEWNPNECGNPSSKTYNVSIILRYDILPVGSLIDVCVKAPTPNGWVQQRTRWNPQGCGHPKNNVQNMKTIKRMN